MVLPPYFFSISCPVNHLKSIFVKKGYQKLYTLNSILMKDSKICVSIGDLSYNEIAEQLKRIDFAEIRLDLLNITEQELKSIFESHSNLIATCRKTNLTDKKRIESLSNALRWGAAYVDIELELESKFRKPIVELAHQLNKKVIISYHNFKETPDKKELHKIIKHAIKNGGDYVKVACKVASSEDSARILGLYADFSNVIAIGMGSGGIITRVTAPLMGAPFTYASLPGKETAPGQLDENQLSTIINLLEQFTSGKK